MSLIIFKKYFIYGINLLNNNVLYKQYYIICSNRKKFKQGYLKLNN